MEMINRCLEITEAKREALEAFDARKRMLEERAFLREQRTAEVKRILAEAYQELAETEKLRRQRGGK